MSETNEYPIGKINYERYKKTHHDKIFHDGKTFMVRREHIIKGYDLLLRKWDVVKTTEEILSLSALREKPSKVVETDIIVYRSATDYKTLKRLEAFFKKTMRVSVKDLESNIYLVLVDGKVFMTDLMKVTAPLQLNSVARNVKLEFIGEETRLTTEEKDVLIKQGIPLFEEREQPNGETQYLLMV